MKIEIDQEDADFFVEVMFAKNLVKSKSEGHRLIEQGAVKLKLCEAILKIGKLRFVRIVWKDKL